MDPFQLVASEMQFLSKNIRRLIGSGHPSLDTVAKYYTQATGKRFRPLLVLLMSRATSRCPRTTPSRPLSFEEINEKMTHPDILLDTNPDQAKDHEQATTDEDPHILPAQRRLAEITELIHTASLLHDDVIDGADTRRASPSANLAFGNKMSILAGDFMLGRASVALARLRNAEVIELLATVIANLVEGEVMQLKNSVMEEAHPTFSDDMLQYYLQKTYLKSASLISKSCRAATILGSCEPDVVDKAYAFGKNLGLCFQLVDDMLDYTVSAGELGKPAGADLHLGLATAPLLFAWKSDERLGELVGRRFSEPGDVDTVSSDLSATYTPAATADSAYRPEAWFSKAKAWNRRGPWPRNTPRRQRMPSPSSRIAKPSKVFEGLFGQPFRDGGRRPVYCFYRSSTGRSLWLARMHKALASGRGHRGSGPSRSHAYTFQASYCSAVLSGILKARAIDPQRGLARVVLPKRSSVCILDLIRET